jgi:DNA repair exonuclease SbcCD ATPase subunit
VRIWGWQIDGFGAFAGYSVAELPDGLVLITGPNEAGKTTLRDFIRGVLFGFPDGRSTEPSHPPVAGGGHGGTLWLVDERAQRYRVTRHPGAPRHQRFRASGPGGEEIDEDGLRRLLGGADKALYRSVFAFDLGELSSLESLDQDQVRDRVFSAGVAGAGRSATAARDKLEEQAKALVAAKGRSQATELARRLSDLERRRDDATRSAEHYPALRHELDAYGRRLESLRHEKARLEAAQRDVDEALRLQQELDDMGPELASAAPQPGDAALFAHELEIRDLQERAALLEARREERRQAEESRDHLEREVAAALAGLPRGLTVDRALEVDAAAVHRDRLGRLAAQRARVDADVENLERHLAELSAKVASAERRAQEAEAAVGGPGGGARLEELRRRVGDARELVDSLDRLERQELESRLAEAARASDATGGPPAGTLLALLALLLLAALAAVVAAAFAAGHHFGVLSGLSGATALVALVALGLAWHAARARRDPGADEPGADGGTGAESAALAGRVRVLASALSFAAPPTLPEARRRVEDLEAELAEVRERHAAAEQAATELSRLRDDALARRADLDDALAKRADLERKVAEVAASTRLASLLDEDVAGDPSTLRQLLEAVGSLQETVRRRDEAAARYRRLGDELDEFDRAVERLCGLLTEETGGEAASPAASLVLGTPPGDVARELGRALAAAENRRSTREALARRDEDLRRRREAALERLAASGLGLLVPSDRPGGRDAPEPVPGLVDLERWSEELAARLADLDQQVEATTRAHEEARLDLARLEGAADLPRVLLELEEVEAQLEQVLESWLVAKVAEKLVVATLERYQNERQPAVVKRAGELFAAVTDRRYVALRTAAGADRRGSSRVEVQRADGAWLDAVHLSRGASEQLYLCLRLALALGFAASAVPLPVLMDDVLVNFDPERAAGVARALADVATELQVVFLTCHPHVAELLAAAVPRHHRIDLARFP